jgi:hypothetical protein
MTITFDFSKHKTGVEQATYDAMPDDVKPYYEKSADGKYAVSAVALPLVDTLLGVVAGIRDERGKVTRLNTENAGRRLLTDAFEGIASELGLKVEDGKTVADAIKAHVDALTLATKNGKDVQINLEKIKSDFKIELANAVKAKDTEIGGMRGSLEKYLVDAAATAALAAEKGNTTLLMPHVKSQVKVVADAEGNYGVRVVDAQGNVRFGANAQEMGIADLVTEMKANKTFAGAFESTQAGGTGARPGNQPLNLRKAATGEMTADQKMAVGLAARGAK